MKIENYKENKKGTKDSKGKIWNTDHDKVLRNLERHKYDSNYFRDKVLMKEFIEFGTSLTELLERCEYLEHKCPPYLLKVVNSHVEKLREDEGLEEKQVQQLRRLMLLCHMNCQNPLKAGGVAMFEKYHLNVGEENN